MSALTCFVYLADDNGEVHGFGPRSVVPDWARAKITNPHVWDSPSDPVEPHRVAGPATEVSRADVGVPDQSSPPPQGGVGASRQKWVDYATSKGLVVRSDWKREDIIAACEKAGVPV